VGSDDRRRPEQRVLVLPLGGPAHARPRFRPVINIASQLGIKGGERLVHYCAAKAGVIGLTEALARELAPQGVLVNASAPGPVETPLVDHLSDEWKHAK
jgi:NAD(P)-dependent dehydrogenase (short-subunit alcohol dehydrogenase family)